MNIIKDHPCEILHIGFDDTDSTLSRCTTQLAFKITDYLLKEDAKFIDYPLLIRLNPNVPWKTRGNGAVCLRISVKSHDKIIEYIKNTFPHTFNNYDQNHRRILITPHGPDPVFCGIRGECPEVVVSSLERLELEEKLDGYMVFRSNQGTNMHLQNELKLSHIK